MALNTTRYATGIKNKLIAKFAWPEFDEAELTLFCEAIAEATVEEFATNAEFRSAVLQNNAITGVTDDVPPANVSGTVTDTTVTGGIQ